MPTTVAGIARCATWAPSDGLFGKSLHALGIDTAYSRVGVVIALVFIGLPFVVRSLRFGEIALPVHDGEVVQIARTEKTRIAQTAGSAKPRR